MLSGGGCGDGAADICAATGVEKHRLPEATDIRGLKNVGVWQRVNLKDENSCRAGISL